MNKPNILLITTDQQHWDTIGSFNSEVHTPNIDRLVSGGTVFNRAYCPNPTCTPTRSSIITGMYPSQHGAWSLGTKLSEDIPTLGDDLQEKGYRTALVGKAHFQPLKSTEEYPSLESISLLHNQEFWNEFTGPFYGFENVELLRNHAHEHLVGQHYVKWMKEKGLTNWRDYFAKPTGKMTYDNKYEWNLPEKYHYNAFIAEKTIDFIDEYNDNNENFFLWASFPDPHPPYLASNPWDEMYDPDHLTTPQGVSGEHELNPNHFQLTQETNPDMSAYQETGYGIHGMHSHLTDEESVKKNQALYYGMVSFTDKYIGKILDYLETNNLMNNTVIVFTSDHGHLFGQHDLHYKGPFHYEDLLRVPFIVQYPNQVPAGKTSNAMQSLVDLAPTFLSLTGGEIPNRMAGIDQLDVWKSKKEQARDHVICENRHEPTAIYLRTYVDERYKITVYYNQTHGELFDLKEDPGEHQNLWDSSNHQALKNELLMRYIWAELEKETMWMPRISHA